MSVIVYPKRGGIGGGSDPTSTILPSDLPCSGLSALKAEIALASSGAGTGRPLVMIGDSTTRGQDGSANPVGNQALYSVSRRLGNLIQARTRLDVLESVYQQGSYGSTFDALRLSLGSWALGANAMGGKTFVATGAATMIFTPPPFCGRYSIIDVYYVQTPGGGTFNVVQNGATLVTNHSTDGVALNAKLTISVASSSHPISIVRTAGTVNLNGIGLRTPSSLALINGARGGSDTLYYDNNTDVYSSMKQLQDLNPAATIINLAINDWRAHGSNSNYTLAKYQERLGRIIGYAKAGGGGVIVMTGTPTDAVGETNYAVQQQYVDAALEVAAANGVRSVDTWRRWNGSHDGGPAGSAGADRIHPTAIGYDDISRALFDVIAT